jgi:hypothetical protein
LQIVEGLAAAGTHGSGFLARLLAHGGALNLQQRIAFRLPPGEQRPCLGHARGGKLQVVVGAERLFNKGNERRIVEAAPPVDGNGFVDRKLCWSPVFRYRRFRFHFSRCK